MKHFSTKPKIIELFEASLRQHRVEIFDSGFFRGQENVASIFVGWLDLSRDFWGHSNQTEDLW